MATSDNVVRAGLTPNHRDVKVLCSMLTYNSFNCLSDLLLKPSWLKGRPFVQIYRSPVKEFSVMSIELPALSEDSSEGSSSNYSIGRSLMLCTEGSAELTTTDSSVVLKVEKGSVLYLPEKFKYSLKNYSENDKCVIYQAFEPVVNE